MTSLAKSLMLDWTYLGRLLMMPRTRIGPNALPYGTPECTALGSEATPLMTSHWVLSDKKHLLTSGSALGFPFFSSRAWGTQLKALLKSIT